MKANNIIYNLRIGNEYLFCSICFRVVLYFHSCRYDTNHHYNHHRMWSLVADNVCHLVRFIPLLGDKPVLLYCQNECLLPQSMERNNDEEPIGLVHRLKGSL